MRTKISIAILAAGASIASPAYADMGANATLTNITVKLISLNGTTPWIYYTSGMTFTGEINGNNMNYGGDFNINVTTATSYINASVQGSNNGANFPSSMTANGSSIGTFNASAQTLNVPFILSADTVALFSATGTAIVSGQNNDRANAYAGLQVWGSNGDIQNASDALDANYDYRSGYSGGGGGNTLTASFVNGNSGGTANGDFLARTSIYGYAGAVPEPSEWALMASGLGIIGFMVRRKKSA